MEDKAFNLKMTQLIRVIEESSTIDETFNLYERAIEIINNRIFEIQAFVEYQSEEAKGQIDD